MDLYEKKFAEMQKYIPFLEAMIDRLKKVKDKSRESQLQKMQSLHGILSNSNGKKLTIEKLERCEEVLLKLHSKVDKGNTSGGLTTVKKEIEDVKDVKPIITGNVEAINTVSSSIKTERGQDSEMYYRRPQSSLKMPKMEETPASPSPPASPDPITESRFTQDPIIIPTERSDGFTDTISDDRPASPDACELIATIGMRQPIIIPTERAENRLIINPLRKIDPDPPNKHIPTVNNYSDNKHVIQQKTNLWQTQRRNGSERGPSTLRHIPTVPTPSKGSSLLRKPVLILDKNVSDIESPTSKWESPQPSVPEPRLISPDRDSYSSRSSITSPKSKELPPLPKLPATPLLVSPPPVLKDPPLTKEDLAELLQDESDKQSEYSKDKIAERLSDDGKKSSPISSTGCNKDGKSLKTANVTHDDADLDNERRWEEEYRHIVKMPSRRVFTSPSGTPMKHSDPRGSSNSHGSTLISTERPTDPRNRPPSPTSKDRDPSIIEPRYADNYEKHPRGHPRDSHKHNSVPDLNPINSAFSRASHNDSNNCDDRGSAHYQQRPYGSTPVHVDQPTDPRRDNSDFYRGIIRERERENQQNANRAPIHHSPGRSGDSCNQSQWGPNPNYQNLPQNSNMQYQQRPDMWPMNQGANNMDPHMMGGDPSYNRPSHYPPGQNQCGRPMMSPQDMNHGPCMDQGFRDDIPNQSMIPSLMPQMCPPPHPSSMMQSQSYPSGPPYRNFAPENRPNVQQQFDRPQDFPHPRQSWEQQQQQPVNRPPESYPRPTGPGPWNRANRGGPPPSGVQTSVPPLPVTGGQGGRERSFNDRGRPNDSSRPGGFSRDPRTRNDPPAPPTNSGTRPRTESSLPSQISNSPTGPSNTRREHSRFSKDSPQASNSKFKDRASSSDHNSRRRPDTKDTSNSKHNSSKDSRKNSEKKRSYCNEKRGRREADNDSRNVPVPVPAPVPETPSRDVMHSPLESLYGAIDTAAKTGKGYGIQGWKIPKIKKPDPVPSPSRTVHDTVEENWDTPDESSATFDDSSPVNRSTEVSIPEVSQTNRNETDDKKAEVTSTTSESTDEASLVKATSQVCDNSDDKEEPQPSTEESAAIDTSTKNTEEVDTSTKKSEYNEQVVEQFKAFVKNVTPELITMVEALNKRKDIQKLLLGKASQSKDSESALSTDDEETEKKSTRKKKSRVQKLSDSSDEECLAERLSLKNTASTSKSEATKSRDEDTVEEDKTESKTKECSKKSTSNENSSTNNAIEVSDDSSRDATSQKDKPSRRKKHERKGKSKEAAKDIPTDGTETAVEVNEISQEAPTSPNLATKTRIRRRNSLEMLQEDVREMFISSDVVTANGHRMCRLIKEAQSQSVVPSQSNSSLDLQSAKGGSDGEVDIPATTRAATKGKAGSRARSRRRVKGRYVSRQTAKETVSSGSEDDDLAATAIGGSNDTSNATKVSDESAKSDTAEKNLNNSKDESEETYFLRRSERVGLRESMKEPKTNNQKSELGKIDSSKIMFDYSSDESFGIDVSELTAAVDISLHPEPQALTSSSPLAKPPTVKLVTTRKQRISRRRGNAAKTSDDKAENAASGDEADSIASDLSRASSLTRGKKTNTPMGKPDTNEVLFSDFLTSFVDPKTPAANNDVGQGSTPATSVKVARKKKKKKTGWACGVVKNKNKKKKKTTQPVRATVEGPVASSLSTISTDQEQSFDVSGKTKNDPKNGASLNMDIEPKEEILSDSSAPKSTEETPVFVVQKEEPPSPVKSQKSTGKDFDDTIHDKKPLEELLTDVGKSNMESEPNIEGTRNIGIRRLTSYAWSTRKDKFNCLYCPFNGKNIVHHYKVAHPEQEVMISRLPITEARRAIRQAAAIENAAKTSNNVSKETRKFICRFCEYTSEGSSAPALEAFYEHCTTHTGEYRFRCNSCIYQTVARSSMKTHYYRRSCEQKFPGNIGLSLSEDPVPAGDHLHGYLCSKCNFVQLKEMNLKKHVKLSHGEASDIEIVKINMSSYVEDNFYKSGNSIDDSLGLDTTEELKIEEHPMCETVPKSSVTTDGDVSATDNYLTGRLTEGSDKIDIVDEALKNEEESDMPCSGKSTDVPSEPEPTSLQESASDGPSIAGNLSVFVCPPELENKEAEIQHERRKKMQEIVENIGILNKVNEKRDLSIIDKLKDKMTTDLDQSLEAARSLEAATVAAPETPDIDAPAMNLPVLVIESVTSLAKVDSNSKEPPTEKGITETSPQDVPEATVKNEPSDVLAEISAIPNEKDEDIADKTEKKLKDPLANLDELRKDDSSDGEDTDNENATEHPRSYDSDSSTDQSDSEIPADVNSLLDEINSSANAPMMTTIQRLAAQLQGEKSFPVGEAMSDKVDDSEQELAEVIPKAPKTIPIACVQRFLGRRTAMLQEVAKEITEPIVREATDTPPDSPPKKFIRLRRLSGDKLSVPSPVEPPPSASPPIEVSQPSSIDDSTSEPMAEVLKTDTEEECSFLRIENVMSLAGMENTSSDTMHDIFKAVNSTNVKNATTVSVLRKGSPNILQRPILPASVAGRSSTIPNLPVLPIKSGLAVKNGKFVRLVTGRTSLKQKDSTHRIFGSKMKSPEMFTAMLQPTKLREFYKCMARNCSFTTDCQQAFGAHYRNHKETVDRSKMVLSSYDFQRCPYCTETLTSWKAMSEHLKDKHIYCQFQCSYCFYRALAQSYVELHQMTVHEDAKPSVLLGQREEPPIEVIDRREFVIPFVCHHECGKSFYVPGAFLAHLRTKHGNSLSIFKCHLCPAPVFNAEKLVAHYKLHGIYKYQCLYCVFGSEQASDVHAHLSASHYNRPPHILERTLQPRPVRDKDVIQQLVVLNVDEGYKCTELVLAPGQDITDIPKNKQWIQVDKNTSDGSTVAPIKLPIANVGMNRLLPYEKSDYIEAGKSTSPASATVSPIVTKFRNVTKLSPKKPAENMLIVDDSGGIIKIAKRREFVFSSTPKNSPADGLVATTSSPSKATDPLETTGELQSQEEEFVNINILDDPRILGMKDVESNSSSVNDKGTNDHTENKNEDSDIEILEDIEMPVNKSQTASPIKVFLPEPSKKSEDLIIPEVETPKEESPATITPEVDPVIVCSSTENSVELSVNANPTEEAENRDVVKPLTLADIMNTGFTGRHLFKCGYDSCEFGAETALLLRTHIKECIFATETKNLNCVHCNKRFVKIGFLLEHFKLHGLKRFGCSLCTDRWPMSYQAMAHMKSKHRQAYPKLIPADPKNPSADGLFIVESVPTGRDRTRGKKRGRVKSSDKDGDKMLDVEKLAFGPTEIEALPRQPIFQREVHCAVCPYTNKVRINIIRHLQLHAKDETVPESGPVNPVPCLDKKEKMFDKMVNLASSSHQNGRMGGTKIKDPPAVESDAEFLPKFIPEHKRYVCGVTECNYLSIDEVMLRTHLKALHPDEPYFRCPHCPAQVPGHETQNIAIDKMGIHLKMHDTRLYKCSHCNHHHYHRHVVERHLTDKHSEANPYVKVIREPDTTEAAPQQTTQEDGDEGPTDTEGNHWKCSICEYKCIYKSEMVSHASSAHEEKSQFKCTLCHYKSNNKINFDQHANAKHSNDPNADYTMVYQKIKGSGGMRRTAEGGDGDEPFDTTPLWRRDMPRVRHIRGILFEDEDISQPESSPAKSGKRKSDADISRPAKTRPGKVASTDADKDNESLSGSMETTSSDRRLDLTNDFVDVESVGTVAEKPTTSSLVRKFAPYGTPIAHFYRCTICQSFKTKYKHDMRDHLYRDLKYWRYRCSLCGYMGVSKNATLKHFMRTHENRRPTDEEQTCLPIDYELETWVQTLLKSQTAQMRGLTVDANGNIKTAEVKTRKTPVASSRRLTTEDQPKIETTNITQSPLKDTSQKAETVDLTQAITDMRNKSMAIDGDGDAPTVEDEDSNDNGALVIDSKDDGLEEAEADDSAIVDDGETNADSQHLLCCKHCTMKFSRLRGLKLHVQIRHLRRLAFLCPYCDTSSNSEKSLRKHLAMKHVGRTAEIIPNPVTNLPELTNEFWEKEYGAVIPEKKKRKRPAEEPPTPDPFEKTPGQTHMCPTCGFRAINVFGLGVHMRVHTAVKSFKCAYCSFAASEKVHLWQHSEINHWKLDWKTGNGDGAVPGTSEDNPNDDTLSMNSTENSNDYTEPRGPSMSGEMKIDLMYACFYCNTHRKTIDAVKEHWKTAHKVPPKVPSDPTGQRPPMPFRYKEITLHPLKKILRCGYCPKRGSAASIRLHSRKKHSTKPVKFVEIPIIATLPVSPPAAPAIPILPDGWICQWCNEFCDSEAKKKIHQNMFHSHLPASFKRQENSNANAEPDVEASNCPECPFKTTSLVAMQKHVVKHVDSSRCTRCDKNFPDVTAAINHNRQAHRGEISAIESFVPNIEKIMARVIWRGGENSVKSTTVRKNCGVARKSTTKSSLRINPTPTDYRAVARKSTNPLPRYPPGIRFNTDGIDTTDFKREPAVSYYGKPRVPVNLTNISTYITLGGGRQMKLTCTALAQLFNIEPRVMVEDIKKKFNVST